MARITFKVYNRAGALADADAVVLSDSTGTYGIKRNDTGATVIASGTAMTNPTTGTYIYDFTPPARLVEYTVWVKVSQGRLTAYYELLYTPPAGSLTFSTPADVIWQYLIDTAELFTDPSDGGLWPMYKGRLPDADDIEDDLGAIFNTPGVLHGPTMDGIQRQHYSFQIRVRAVQERDAYEKLQNVATSLLTVHRQNVVVPGDDTYRIDHFTQTSDVVLIQVDAKDRTHAVLNMLVSYERV